jgi:putative DNA primase/helicase
VNDQRVAQSKPTRQDLLDAALGYAAKGIPVFPCKRDKKPVTKNGFLNATTDENQIRKWWEETAWSIGVPTGQASKQIVFDVDGPNGETSFRQMEAKHGPLPETLQVGTQEGRHLYFQWPGVHIQISADGRFGGPGLDMRGDGGYVIVPPSPFPNGNGQYTFINSLPLAMPPAALIELANTKPDKPKSSRTQHQQAGTRVNANLLVDRALHEAERSGRNNGGFWLACQLRDNRLSQSEALPFMERYVAQVKHTNMKGNAEPFTRAEAEASLEQAYGAMPREPWGRTSTAAGAYANVTNEPTGDTVSLLEGYHPQDVGNAERLVRFYGKDLRYCATLKTWFHWDGRRWAPDETNAVRELAHQVIIAFAHQAVRAENKGATSFAMQSFRSARITNMLREAEPYLAVRASELDQDSFLFNCANGTIDLRTGELRPHRQDDFLTKLSPVNYDPESRSELWEQALHEWTAGNEELINFLQYAAGYTLTGDIREEVLFFIHGPTNAGKSTFLEALRTVAGDYAKTADFETFLRKKQHNLRDDIAELTGKRFVCSIEVEEGKELAEGIVKMLTGGDHVRGRPLYRMSFDYLPQFKLWLAANHAPVIKYDDDAIWRRIHRVPFLRTFTNPDPTVKANMRDPDKVSAVLTWAVQGCLAWQQAGLHAPTIVRDATEQLRLEMDPLRDFFTECCLFGPLFKTFSAQLHQKHENWAKQNGSRPVDPKKLAAGLRARGAVDRRSTGGRIVWNGVGLCDETEFEPSEPK